MSTYPLVMHHPGMRRSRPELVEADDPLSGRKYRDFAGAPDSLPPVEVNNATQEEFYRAKGYLAYGEHPKVMTQFVEYPKMMMHPGHVDATLPQTEAIPVEGHPGNYTTYTIPGRPEVFPHVTVLNADEEAIWEAKGYASPKGDAEAFDRAKAAPVPNGYVSKDYPKWVDGVLVPDPDAKPPNGNEYPKWVGNEIVNDRAAEDRVRLAMGLPITHQVPTAPELPPPLVGELWPAPAKPDPEVERLSAENDDLRERLARLEAANAKPPSVSRETSTAGKAKKRPTDAVRKYNREYNARKRAEARAARQAPNQQEASPE